MTFGSFCGVLLINISLGLVSMFVFDLAAAMIERRDPLIVYVAAIFQLRA
jgi:hypothetical protein